MNRIGNSTPLTIAGDAVAVEITHVVARPSPQKQKAPISKVKPSAAHRPGNVTPYTRMPTDAVRTTRSKLTTSEEPMLPAMNSHGGNGVPRIRLRTPASRRKQRPIARLV